MELNKKLQELRRQRGITQEELAGALFVSRTAVSKWESGRGYPNIESLKAIAKYFSVTVDELLSSDEILTIAEESGKQRERRFFDLVYGFLDISLALFFLLPLFGQVKDGVTQAVSLLFLTEIKFWLLISYYAVIALSVAIGILTLAIQGCTLDLWVKNKAWISLFCTVLAASLFMLSRHPYASVLTFILILIKVIMLLRKR